MPEYVAGLQFESVYIIDANAFLITQMGGGATGLQRFVSAMYLGASRARTLLSIFADKEVGGFAKPVRDALDVGVVKEALPEKRERLR